MSGWAFFGGAADDLRQQLQTRRASEQEQKMWEDRITFQQKLQQEVEAARERNRTIAEGIDPVRGVAYKQTASGYEETPLDPRLAENVRATNALQAEKERIEREREERKFQSQLSKDEATIESARARAENNRNQMSVRNARLPGQIEYDRARAEAARSGKKEGEASGPSDSERRQSGAAATTVSNQILQRISSLEDEDLAEIVKEARQEALREADPVRRLEALQLVQAELEARLNIAPAY